MRQEWCIGLRLPVQLRANNHLGDHSIKIAKESDFRGMQFNAIAESNKSALHTYKSLGFKEVGMIPQGFRLKDGSYSNMYIVLYLSLL